MPSTMNYGLSYSSLLIKPYQQLESETGAATMANYVLRVMRDECEVVYRDQSGSFILSQLKQMWQRFAQLPTSSTHTANPEEAKPCGLPHSFWLQRGGFIAEVASDTDVKFIQSVMSLWCHAMIEGQWPGSSTPIERSVDVAIVAEETLPEALETTEAEAEEGSLASPSAQAEEALEQEEDALSEEGFEETTTAMTLGLELLEEQEPAEEATLPVLPRRNPLSALSGAIA
jgi:hypothetical protein